MTRYITKRLLLFTPTLLACSILIFVLMRVVPGDVAFAILGDDATLEGIAILTEELGLDDPLAKQYATWIWRLLRFDLGESLLYKGVEVRDMVTRAYPITMTMTIYGMVITILFAVPIGIFSALKSGSFVDYVLRGFSIGGVSIPTFWLAIFILFLLTRFLHWAPDFRYVSFLDSPWGNFKIYIIPAAVFGYHNVAVVARMLRSQLLEVVREDYVRTARAKGLRSALVIYRHALPNALLPVLTIAGGQFAAMISGLVVVERIFALPGLGTLMISGATNVDYNVVQSLFLIIAIMVLSVNLLVDLLYGWLDPRIRLE